jgi:hypothetical protein
MGASFNNLATPMATSAPTSMDSAPQIQNQLSTLNTGQTSNPFSGATNPYIQASQANALGNMAGAQAATAANRVNQNTPYGSLQFQQTGTDAQGNPIWSANQQLSPELQALTQQSLGGLQQSLQNPMYGINPGQTYSEAIMSRLQPQIQRQNQALDTQLANQGIMPGSQAYETAKTLASQQQNDLLTSAQIQGMNTGLQAQQLQNTQAANIRSLATPNYVNPYAQAAVAGPDYLGAYTTSNAAQIAAQNARNAQTANLQNGLFGLGSAALLGSGGVGGLASGIGTGIGALGNLASNAGTGIGNWWNSLNNSSIYGTNDWSTPTMSSADVLGQQSFGGLF